MQPLQSSVACRCVGASCSWDPATWYCQLLRHSEQQHTTCPTLLQLTGWGPRPTQLVTAATATATAAAAASTVHLVPHLHVVRSLGPSCQGLGQQVQHLRLQLLPSRPVIWRDVQRPARYNTAHIGSSMRDCIPLYGMPQDMGREGRGCGPRASSRRGSIMRAAVTELGNAGAHASSHSCMCKAILCSCIRWAVRKSVQIGLEPVQTLHAHVH